MRFKTFPPLVLGIMFFFPLCFTGKWDNFCCSVKESWFIPIKQYSMSRLCYTVNLVTTKKWVLSHMLNNVHMRSDIINNTALPPVPYCFYKILHFIKQIHQMYCIFPLEDSIYTTRITICYRTTAVSVSWTIRQQESCIDQSAFRTGTVLSF